MTGSVNMFCPESTIVHIDIDASEINKNKKVAYPIRANVKDALRVLNSALAAKAGSANPPATPALLNGSA